MSRRTACIAAVALASLLAGPAQGAGAPQAGGTGAAGAPAAAGALRLDDAVHLALTRNERARISDLNVVVAEAAVEKARAAFLPLLTAQGSDVQHAYAADRGPNNIGTGNVTLTQSVLNASSFPLYAQALRLADAAHAQNVDDKRVLSFAAASAFFLVLNAQEVLHAAQRQLENAKANLQDTQARAQGGFTSSNDVTRAQIDMASSAREVETDQGTLESVLFQLAFTINAPVPSGLEPPQATFATAEHPPGPADALVRLAMDRRPDIVAARYQLQAARDFAGEPLLRMVPTLSVQGQVTATTNPPVAGRWNDELLQATLNWSIYDQGVRYADKHSRDAQAEISDLTLQQLVRSVDEQVHATTALLVAAQAAFRVAQDAVNAARQSVDETAILYGRGLAKAIELVDANDKRFTAEIEYASAEYGMAQAYLNLRQALGLDPLGTELK
jgi:outer membrane protein TolC